MYYKVPSYIHSSIRIDSVKYGKTICSCGMRKYILNYKINDECEGQRYYITGKIEKQNDIQKGICGQITVSSIKKQKDDFYSKLQKMKYNVYKNLKENIGKRKASFIASIAYGYSKDLDSDDKDDMQSLGIIHAISVSGLHVAFIFAVFSASLSKKISIIITFIYVLFTGCSVSCIRAFIMLLSVFGAEALRRNNNSMSALSLSGIIILLINPSSAFEISFHLSF